MVHGTKTWKFHIMQEQRGEEKMCVSLKCTIVILHLSLKPNTEEFLNLYQQEANSRECFVFPPEEALCYFIQKQPRTGK